MSIIAVALRHMLAAGMDHEAIIAAVEEMEGSLPSKASKGAERTRRWRENKASQSVTERHEPSQSVTCDAPPETKVSPRPPSKTQTPLPPSPPKGGSSPAPRKASFEQFWQAYPSKVGKRAAELAYERAVKRLARPDSAETIQAGVIRATASQRWRDGYIPNPATWLNQDRWEDGGSVVDIGVARTAAMGDDEWREAVTRFRDEGRWPERWGPPPDNPGCTVKQAILEQSGYREASG